MNHLQLFNNIIQKRSFLCVGLDSEIEKIPSFLKKLKDPVFEFNKRIIDATQEYTVAYKPNLAFYESRGSEGWLSLEATVKYIKKKYSGIFVIADAKRGDIGNTSERYAKSLFDDFHFDSITVNPYMGFDSVEPFLKNPEKGVFLLALTSNNGSKDFQRLKVNGKPLYEKVVRAAKKWNTNRNIGLVIGATHPRELKMIRKIVPEMPLLIPGIGKQGGDLKSAVQEGCDKNGQLAIINASRSIIYASSGKDFAAAARAEATKIVEEIRSL